MRIVGLKLRNYRIFRELDWEFGDGNLFAFIGENGSGKSAVVDALCLGIAHFAKAISLESAVIDLIDSWSISSRDVTVGEESCTVEVKLMLDNESVVTARIEYYKQSSSGSARLYRNENVVNNAALVDRYKRAVPVLACFQVSRASFRYVKEEAKLNKVENTLVSTYIGAFDEEYPTIIDFQRWYLFEQAAENQEKVERKDLTYSIDSLNVIRHAVESLLKILFSDNTVELKVIRSDLGTTFWLDGLPGFIPGRLAIVKQSITIPIGNLSHGEKSVLILTIEIARRLYLANQTNTSLLGNGVILIDEIELHLHPAWQRGILPALRKTFPNVQFIVTTHSPQTLSTLMKDQIVVVENGQLYQADTDPLGRDTNGILEELMNVDKRPAAVDDLIDEIMAMLYADTPDFSGAESKLERLRTMVASSDPILTRIEALMRRRKALA